MDALLRRLIDHARRRPDAAALRFPTDARVDDRPISWSTLLGRVGGRAASMQARGVRDGHTVLVVHASTHDQIVDFLAALVVGARPSIMSYPSVKQDRARFFATFGPLVERFAPEWLSVAADWRALVDDLGPALLPQTTDGEAPLARLPERRRHAPLFLQFSSGTTGLRKGVAITAAMLEHQLEAYGRRLGVRSDDVVVSWLPLYHDMGLVAAFLYAVHHGLYAVHFSPFAWLRDPTAWLRAISAEGGTVCHTPNFALELLAERADVAALRADGVRLGGLRALVNCSEPVRAASVRRFVEAFSPLGLAETAMQASYAMAECTFAVTQTDVGAPPRFDVVDRDRFAREHVCAPAGAGPAVTFVSCGTPIDDIDVRIVDAPADRHVGEIAIRGPSVVPGYLAAADADDAFADGWFRTGDLGYLADGQLYVTGRRKDLVICRGHNVYPDDVEQSLSRVTGIKAGRAVVFGVDDRRYGTERLVAMAERDGAAPDDAIALAGRQRVLEDHGVGLDDLALVEAGTLLKSTSGKLSRNRNRALYLERQPADAPPPPAPEPETAPRLDYYVLADGVKLLGDGDDVHLTHPRGTRLTIPRRLYMLAHRFRIPRTLDSYRHKARRARRPDLIEPLLDGAFLVSAGFRSVFGEDDWYALVKNPRSRHLVIQFRGGAYDLVAGVPPRAFARKTGVDAHNLLVLRDVRARFYVDGVSPEVPSFEALITWLRGFVTGLGVEHVHTLGTSMGAYAALRAAHALGTRTAWAFGPAQPAAGKGVPLADAMAEPNGTTDYHLWFCRDYDDDRAVAEAVADHPGMTLHPIPGKSHWVAQLLDKRGKLPRLIEPPSGPAPATNPTGPAETPTPERVLELVRRVIPRAPVTLTVDTPLTGLLDSFASTHLLSLLTRTFGARVDPARVTDTDLASVPAIMGLLTTPPIADA